MPRYEIEIELTANRSAEPMRAMVVGDSPIVPPELLKAMGSIAKITHQSGISLPPMGGAGLALRKSIIIEAPSFQALAEILGKFDSLADEVECNHPAREA